MSSSGIPVGPGGSDCFHILGKHTTPPAAPPTVFLARAHVSLLLAQGGHAHSVSLPSQGIPAGHQGPHFIRPVAEAQRRSVPSPPFQVAEEGVESGSSDSSLTPGLLFLNCSHAGRLRFITMARLVPHKPHSDVRLSSNG